MGNISFVIMNIFKKALRILLILKRNGFLHSCHLVYIYFISPLVVKVLPIFLKLYTAGRRRIEKYCYAEKYIRDWRKKKEELLKLGKAGYRFKIENLVLNQAELKSLKKAQNQAREVIIGEIDQDGFCMSYFGPIQNVSTVSENEFLKRKKFNIKLVALGGYIGCKKDYKGNKLSFINEIRALHILGLAGCNVSSIMDVDFNNLTLTVSYIFGPILREELAKKGAILRDRDVENSPNFLRLEPKEREFKRITQGKKFLYEIIDSQFVEELFVELKKIHESKFIYNDIKYGNIIIEKESGKPYLIDFDNTIQYPKLGRNFFRILRNREIEKFNLHFNTEKLTYKKIREKIIRIENNDDIYAPVYFGSDLKIGNIWDVGSGYGRWHYILKSNLPPLSGKHILDLGANNAFISINMLRSGAKEVIGIELSSNYIAQGNFVKAGFEWVDNTQYNFKYIRANMKEIPTMNLNKFDIVFALCSLYYLSTDSITNLVQYISNITDIFVVQCNIEKNINRSNADTYRKASLDYNKKILKSNGFPVIQIINPYRYARPLIIGRKEKITYSSENLKTGNP